jgi:hypothetical protein
MATKKQTEVSEQVRDEFCCLMDADYKARDIKAKLAPKPVLELRRVQDCCGCGCNFMYYEDQFGTKHRDQAGARLMVANGKAKFVEA